MYLPEHFREENPATIAAILRDAPLACIVANTAEGLVANHIPLLTNSKGILIGHVARANPLHQMVGDGAEVLVIFRGPDGYVTPRSYPSKAEHHRHVPTWNYIAVHVTGQISFQHDEPSKRAAVALLTREHEKRVNGDAAWRMTDAPADYMAVQLANIVALRIVPLRVIAKAKLSQNREPRDVRGAVQDLSERGHAALAALMQARAPDP